MRDAAESKKKFKGFSLIEILIAVSILSIGLISALKLISVSVSNSTNSRDRIIAVELAQEGVEIIRNIWESGVMDGESFISSTRLPQTSSPTTCCVDKDSSKVTCGSCPSMKLYTGANNFYYRDYGTGAANATKFQRLIGITYQDVNGSALPSVAGADRMLVRSTVIWGSNFPVSCTVSNKCVSVQEIITNSP